jgi:transcription initiation factor TFIID subunit 10
MLEDSNSPSTGGLPEEQEDHRPMVTLDEQEAKVSVKRDEEEFHKDISLLELMQHIENYTPTLPDTVIDYYLAKSGFETDDVRIKRVIALAAQKFIADIAYDALQYCKLRQQSTLSAQTTSMASAMGSGGGSSSGSGGSGSSKKLVLTMEDLAAALAEYGIQARRPDYYR